MDRTLSPIDIARAREDTPGCRGATFLDSASASLMPIPVSNSIVEYVRLESLLGGSRAARESEDRIAACYSNLATLLNCTPSEIALFDSATRAWQVAVSSVKLNRGDRVLTVSSEYGSNYLALREIVKRHGAILHVLDTDESGLVDLSSLARCLEPSVRLLTVPHVANNACVVQPINEIVQLAHRASVPVLVDCSQSIGQIRVDTREIGCDMLCGTGRKWLRGPKGTAFLHIAESFLANVDPPFASLHGGDWVNEDRFERHHGARVFETWEANVAARLGLGVAVEYAMAWGIDSIYSRVKMLVVSLRAQLEEIRNVVIFDKAPQQNGIVTFGIRGIGARDVRRALAEMGVHVSIVRFAHARIDSRVRGLPADLVRASPHYFNVEAELHHLVESVKRLASSSGVR